MCPRGQMQELDELPSLRSPLPLRERVRVRGEQRGLNARTYADEVFTLYPSPQPSPSRGEGAMRRFPLSPSRASARASITALVAIVLLLAAAGCATIRVTDPPRSATEQFLESEATRKAIDQLSAE